MGREVESRGGEGSEGEQGRGGGREGEGGKGGRKVEGRERRAGGGGGERAREGGRGRREGEGEGESREGGRGRAGKLLVEVRWAKAGPRLDQRHEGPSGAGADLALCSHKDVITDLPAQQLVQGSRSQRREAPQSKRRRRARSAFTELMQNLS